MKSTLSIAIVTRNRPESLERTLASLAKQSIRPFEILISDDSNNEVAIAANKELAQAYHGRYVKGPQRGLYANRNFAAIQCSGTHIRSMDDDHEFPENHLEACMQAIEQDERAIWVIGEFDAINPQRVVPAPVPGQLHPRGFSYAPKRLEQYFGISCGATIYPKEVIERGVLNSEAYKFGMLYLEYGARLRANGFRIRPLQTTYVIHYTDENIESSISTFKDKAAVRIIEGARVFSMLMLSFKHRKNLKNQSLTLLQIVKDLLVGQYSFEVVKEAINHYKNTSVHPVVPDKQLRTLVTA